MSNHSNSIFTFGETAYRIGLQIKKEDPRNALVFSFMHPKDNFDGQCFSTLSDDDFDVAFGNCLEQNERPSSWFVRVWQWLTRHPQEAMRKIVIVAGLGGCYSSYYAPRAAQTAHRRGYQVTAIVQLPFKFEGQKRRQRAEEALRLLQKHSDKQVVLDHSVLSQKFKDLNANDYFNKVDDFTIEAVMNQW